MTTRSLRHLGTTLALIVAFACQETWALASTTGGLTGSVVDADTSAPVAGAQVTASSPSQTASATTDASGHFAFLTLGPDTYTVTVTKAGYQPTSVPGQVVFADTVQTVAVRMPKALKTIAHVTAAAAGALVKSGTTADIYSVNETTQKAVQALGGGGSLNQAYSAISTIPGAYVVPNQTGYFETINIRGGDYDQVGYEFDGVPVIRAFDNYASSGANTLGNAEVQVYNGSTPANSEGNGLAGYINQVIKTGTFPGYATASGGIGWPAFYHQAAIEAGGATPDRNFSYYVGISGANQSYNYINNQNGAGYAQWFGPAIGFIPTPGGAFASLCILGSLACFGSSQLAQGPIQYSAFSTIFDRNAVVNFHIAIPHRFDAGRDDIQILYDNESLTNQLYESADDFASAQCTGAHGVSGLACATYLYGPQVYGNVPSWGCPQHIGGTFSGPGLNSIKTCVVNYGFPNATNPGTYTDPNTADPSDRDHTYNQTVIGKLQYTKTFGSTAFARLYGYTFYSTWNLAGLYGYLNCDFVCTVAPDYELNTHTRGLSGEFEDQIDPQNLVTFQGNYTTATITRMNNHFFDVPTEPAAVIVNSKDPYGGYCFGGTPSGGALPVVNCYNTAATPSTYGYETFGTIGAGQVPSVSGLSCAVPGKPQYGSACNWMLAENGLNAEITPGLVPNFYGWSATDQYRPTDKWLFNIGLRLDTFNFAGGDTLVPPVGGGGPQARAFWWRAFNLDNCQSTTTGAVFANPSPGKLCPAGSIATYMENQTNQNFTFNILQPRISGTYTVNANNVLRFSFGRYTEQGSTAFEQYGTWQEDSADFIGPTFLQYGRNTPGYPILPQTSLNYDLSWESHLKGTDWSFKVTPFLRQTQDQIQEFFLNVKEGFVSGLNAGDQRSQGLELQVQKGDFNRDGLSGLLSFAYTNSYITYGPVNPFGGTVLTGVNTSIAQYNAYTRACVLNPKNPNCGTTSNSLVANACYTTSGTPVGAVSIHGTSILCPHGDFVNPYWFAPIQSIINVHSQFATYDLFPGSTAFPGAYGAYNAPYVASLVVNYKHQQFAITPSFQFLGGERYGYPLSSVGIDPAAGCGLLTGVPGRYNATSCASVINIPNPFTGGFDTLGAFVQPNEFLMNVQLSYQVSPKIQLVGIVSNIVNYCWGGSKEPWTFNDGNICQYATPTIGGIVDPIAPYSTPGSTANPPGHPGSIIAPGLKYPYGPNPGPFLASATNFSYKTPLQFYLTANIKL